MSEEAIYIEPPPEQELLPREIAMRNRFVEQYTIDYDRQAAAIRCGYPMSIANEMGAFFMNDPYCLREIQRLETTPEEEDNATMRKRIISGLIRESNYKGPGSSQSGRVAALAKLAAIHGLDAPIRTKQELVGADGQPLDGVFVIPGVMSPEDWQKAAEAQQSALTQSQTMMPSPTKH